MTAETAKMDSKKVELDVQFKIKTYNKISPVGLEKFSPEHYDIGPEIERPDAILLRSQNLHGVTL